MSEKCEHDWRVDPEGWKEDVPVLESMSIGYGPRPDVVHKESLLKVCVKCSQYRKDWRECNDVADWPKAE